MKPLPAEGSLIDRRTAGPSTLPTALAQTGGPRPNANRKNNASPGRGAYPWMLMASTAVAGVFCYLYVTKPVILQGPVTAPSIPSITPAVVQAPMIAGGTPAVPSIAIGPASDRLPGDPAVAPSRTFTKPLASTTGIFEETNFSVQHVVTAEAPNGIIKRLDFKVPVLYRSRNLLWTKREIGTARELLNRLADYQEKTRLLRAEGVALEDAWNQLMEHSTPVVGLQADSPSLLGNQERPGTNAPIQAGGQAQPINIQSPKK